MVENHIQTGHNQKEKFRNNKLNNSTKTKNIIAAAVALALVTSWYWWYKVVEKVKNRKADLIENIQQFENQKKFLEEFFSSTRNLPDLKWSGWELQKVREDRYMWKDDEWNNMRNWFWSAEIKKVIDWMCRIIESGDLEMVIKKADEAWVPRECVYLALTETWRRTWATSEKGAKWPRQFTRAMAKEFWLIDNQWHDYRDDKEKSTKAAMELLNESYRLVSTYSNTYDYNMSETDKWIWAFYAYNGGGKTVKQWLKGCKWNMDEYPKYQQNTENKNYYCRSIAIGRMLEQKFKECWYSVAEVRSRYLNQENKNTEADIMLKDFLHYRDSALVNSENHKDSTKVNKQSTKILKWIKTKYKNEYNSGLISKKRLDWVNEIIDETISSIK